MPLSAAQPAPASCPLFFRARAKAFNALAMRSTPVRRSRALGSRCDLREAPLRDFTVLYCAIRGDASRAAVMADLLAKLLDGTQADGTQVDGTQADGGRPPRRLVLAGFGLDLKGTGYEDRVKLARAYAFRAEARAAEARAAAEAGGGEQGQGDADALYGDTGGPRVLLEYEIR